MAGWLWRCVGLRLRLFVVGKHESQAADFCGVLAALGGFLVKAPAKLVALALCAAQKFAQVFDGKA
ncbi:MAG: hypothetical protein D4R70_05290 [Betaproteobacteria bacterium]|nr:MAG: hypothetical protein D4R70_05290 [Betaproteobacteria bacterium]